MTRTPQRSLLLLTALALVWGAGLAASVWMDAEPALLLAAWTAGAALLVLLAFYLGLLLRLELLQVQQHLRESALDGAAPAQGTAPVSAFWAPLIDAALANRPALEQTRRDQARLDALQLALEAERAQSATWQRQAAHAEAELATLHRQWQDATRALEPIQRALADPMICAEPETQADEADQAAAAWNASLQTLGSVVDSALSAMTAQNAAIAEREAAIRADRAASAARSAHDTAQRRKQTERLAQTAEALRLLGLNLRLQLSHLGTLPTASSLSLEQTEADLDTLLTALAPAELVAIGPLEAIPEVTPQRADEGPGREVSLAPVQALAQAIAEMQRDRARLALWLDQSKPSQDALRRQAADREVLKRAVARLHQLLMQRGQKNP